MDCIAPIKLRTGNIVACGKCNFCRRSQAIEIAMRTNNTMKHALTQRFITCTYDNTHLPLIRNDLPHDRAYYMTLVKSHPRDFRRIVYQEQRRYLKRMVKWKRMTELEASKWQLKFVLCSAEYGTKFQRPHYHIIAANLHPAIERRLNKIWDKGLVQSLKVKAGAAEYCAKYLVDEEQLQDTDPRVRPFRIFSKGNGLDYVKTHKQYHLKTKTLYVRQGGFKMRMPRYWKEKIFPRAMRERLAAEANNESLKAKAEHMEQLAKDFGGIVRAMEVYAERVQYQHDKIKRDSKSKSKF